MEELFKKILTARIYDVAKRTPLEIAENLSERLNNTVLLKREDLQPSFSFKIRGSYNKISRLTDKEKEAGIICASAGNHAQGVALSARQLGLDALIVMPQTTPRIKIQAVEKLGGQVVLHGDSYSEAAVHCKSLIEKTGRTYIHPFDDIDVIAGQGTIGFELMQQCPELDYVFVPIGGGGLISGVACYLKTIRPETQIIGVEPMNSDAMTRSILDKNRVILKKVGIFADGTAVKQVGELTYQYAQKYVDDYVTVSTDEICSAIKSIYEDTRSIVEPAGALAVAGLKKFVYSKGVTGKKMVADNSGANMNFTRLQFVAERTQTGDKSEALYAVSIPETPGALRDFCEKVVKDNNITEFNYRMAEPKIARLFVGVSIAEPKERQEFLDRIIQHGFEGFDLTNNEVAKLHVRHMVGGKSPRIANEVLFRFWFPERKGALTDFLNSMTEHWNISLFHYRMHGGDYGRVLIGLEIAKEEEGDFKRFLERRSYAHIDEKDNPAYRLFL